MAGPERELLRRRRAAAERLRREVMAVGGSVSHPYFRDLRSHLRSYRRTVSMRDVVAACARADLVYVGDFHAVPGFQHRAADLLAAIASRSNGVGLGVEFVYTRQQHLLDARQAGTLDDDGFRRRMHYRDEWGYPWEGFGALLDRARELGAPVYALDAPPRGGFDGLAARDDHAARVIAAILKNEPGRRLVVHFGESHVSRGHLPRKVKRQLRRLGLDRREVVVFQDPDAIYWQVLEHGDTPPAAVEIDDTTYAMFHTTPLAKYEAYRQVLDRWRHDTPPEEEVDLTPAVHHLIHELLRWLGIRPERRRVRHRAGWVEYLIDAFPEVYGGPEARALIAPILEDHRRSRDEIEEARMLLDRRGVLYESRSNTMFLTRYLPGRAAAEGARFLRAALTGRLFVPSENRSDDPVDRAYGAAFNEAVAYLGSRMVDPASDYLSEDELRAVRTGSRPEGPDGAAGLRTRVRWLAAHEAFERSARRRPPAEVRDPLAGSRSTRRTLARDLGHHLGRTLYRRLRAGTLDRKALRSLFTRPLAPDRAMATVVRLLRESR